MKAADGIPGLELVEASGGTRIRLRVRAGAQRNALLGEHGGALKISVTTPAERGKANRAVLRLLANRLGVACSSLQLLSGQASSDKTVLVPLAPGEIFRRLGESLA